MKIAFFEIADWEKDFFKDSLKNHQLYFSKDVINDETLDNIKDFDIISVFIYSKLGKSILKKLTKLNSICVRATGYDNIDIDYCRKK